jgi:hypothetical protein
LLHEGDGLGLLALGLQRLGLTHEADHALDDLLPGVGRGRFAAR